MSDPRRVSAALARVSAEGVESRRPHVVSLRWQTFPPTRSRTMKKGRRNRQYAKFARLPAIWRSASTFATPPHPHGRRVRGRARGAVGMILRPKCCTWCRRHRRLERHHWDYQEALNVTYLCGDCHAIADLDGFRRSHRLGIRQSPVGLGWRRHHHGRIRFQHGRGFGGAAKGNAA